MRQLIACLCVLFLCAAPARAQATTVEISEEELQAKVAAMMPLELRKLFMTAILSHPTVALSDSGNALSVVADVDIAAPGGLRQRGNVTIRGTLNYRAALGGLFLEEVEVVAMQVDHLPEQYLPAAQAVAHVAATKAFAKYPVYVMKSDTLKQRIAKSLLRSVSIANKKLILEFSLF